MDGKTLTPLVKQCFVTFGVSLNYMTHGLVVGYTGVLIHGLKESNEIPVDNSSATWIASIFGISLILGALMVPSIMQRFGRKPAHISSAAFMTAGWLLISLSTSVASLLFARFLQGLSMGFLAILGSILIGECSSPKHRGALLATISAFIMAGILIVHYFGTILPWKVLGFIFSVISFFDLLIILCLPESPSFLANRGRYEECRRTYHWLRGHDEEDELEKMIKTSMVRKRMTAAKRQNDPRGMTRTLSNIRITLSKKEVFKPIIITLHLYAMNQWNGGITFVSYTRDFVDELVGKDINFGLFVLSIDVQKMISSIIAVITLTKFRRKLVLVSVMSLNIIGFLVIALYAYLRTHGLLSFDHPFIGMTLLYIHTFSQAAGSDALSNTIAGEIFPLKHRGFCGIFGILFFSINETINLKTVPYLLSSIGVHGAYLIYAGIETYCFIMAWWMLPETKGRTLLDIEEEFRGKPLFTEENLVDDQYQDDEKVKLEVLS